MPDVASWSGPRPASAGPPGDSHHLRGVIFTAPLTADPGTRFEYGINTDWLGKVVEATSGTTPDVAVRDGTWAPSEIELNQAPEYWAGGHGLHHTPRDYLKFQRALLGRGELDGVKILAETTVDAAFTNQIGDLDFPESIPTGDPASTYPFNAGPGYKWPYGLLLNTHFWVDPTAGITGAIYTQSLPFVPEEAMAMYADFETALYASR